MKKTADELFKEAVDIFERMSDADKEKQHKIKNFLDGLERKTDIDAMDEEDQAELLEQMMEKIEEILGE